MTRKRFTMFCAAAALIGCPGGMGSTLPTAGNGDSSSGGELSAQCTADFGVSAAAQKVETFLMATSKFAASAAELEGSLKESCIAMGSELGLSNDDMQGDVRGVCQAVSAKLSGDLGALRAEAELTIDVVAVPPRCEVSVDAYAECTAGCQVDVDPGEIDVQCEGGELVGECSGECKGSCGAEVSGQCAGACEGSCSGSCTGTCQGACDGNCTVKNADGSCNGKCEGTCTGTCSAGCTGTCEGECWVDAQASCSGQCKGECSVDFTAPKCTGTIKPPEVEADCKAACDAAINADASCEPGEVEVVIAGNVSSNLEETLGRVRAALKAGYAGVIATGARLKRIKATGRGMVDATKQLGGTGRALGLSAVACITEAAALVPRATASVSVSIEVQASVAGSVSSEKG